MRQRFPYPHYEVQREQLALVHVRLHRAEPRLPRRHLRPCDTALSCHAVVSILSCYAAV